MKVIDQYASILHTSVCVVFIERGENDRRYHFDSSFLLLGLIFVSRIHRTVNMLNLIGFSIH